VLGVSASPLTSSVVVHWGPGTDPQALSAALEAALDELLEGWTQPAQLPTLVATLPLREASLTELFGAAARVIAKLLPASQIVAGGLSAPRRAPFSASAGPLLSRPLRGAARWHALALADVFRAVDSRPNGLEATEVAERRERFGANALPPPAVRSKLAILGGQFASVPVAMLGASALVSLATGGLADAAAILFVMLANAGIGFVTENNAESIISSLGQLASQDVDVLRAGRRERVPPEAIVQGDVLVLVAGTFVAADARLLQADGLVIDESALTGESVPVHKSAERSSPENVPLADRVNMAFRGTLVTGGSGTALVVAIGLDTQIGQVQSLVGAVVQRATPLQSQLEKLGLELAIVAGSVCVGVFGLGLLRGYPPLRMLSTSVSLAVAAIPEGLPTVAITTLALGIRRLADRRVLVRQLNAVETLGAIQVMCLDKTGTITINRMTSCAMHVGLRELDLRTQHDHPLELGSLIDARDFDALTSAAVLCNEVELEMHDGVRILRGSATEGALVQLALDVGLDVAALRARHRLLSTQYRSEKRSYMATLHEPQLDAASELIVSVKGRAPEVLAMCRYQQQDGEVRPLGDAERLSIDTAAERMSGQALRVLGFARAVWPRARAERPISLDGERDLIWLGLIGMSDPPRPGMRDILHRFHGAGIRTVMITGDQGATASAIGKLVELNANGHLDILDATELEAIPPEVLRSLVQRIDIFSRVSPAHKLQIVEALQAAGYTVAMTGDGINDSPALKAADVGVAMGRSGSRAAREVADVILEDDELATMIGGIEQGRTIYDDIKKAVRFILSTNLSEILLTTIGIALGRGETLTPMQLLWVNLMTDIFPELALAVQPPEADVLKRPPRDPSRPMFDGHDLARVVLEGGVLTSAPLLALAYGRGRYGLGPRSGTLAFTVLAVAQLMHVLSSRSEHHTIFDRESLASNRYIPMALVSGIAMQVVATLLPGLRTILGVVPLGLLDWGVVGVTAAMPLMVNETVKLVVRGDPALALPAARDAAGQGVSTGAAPEEEAR
jgi:Ca2+-transporting ATPase